MPETTVIDVTAQCDCGSPDEDCLPLTKCVCGVTYAPWTQTIGDYAPNPRVMPCCGRKLYLENHIRILEVVD